MQGCACSTALSPRIIPGGLPLQVVGFVVLVSGTSLYNELIRSCLPTMYESTVDSDIEVRCLHRSRMPV